jgi:hypothetical protein
LGFGHTQAGEHIAGLGTDIHGLPPLRSVGRVFMAEAGRARGH